MKSAFIISILLMAACLFAAHLSSLSSTDVKIASTMISEVPSPGAQEMAILERAGRNANLASYILWVSAPFFGLIFGALYRSIRSTPGPEKTTGEKTEKIG